MYFSVKIISPLLVKPWRLFQLVPAVCMPGAELIGPSCLRVLHGTYRSHRFAYAVSKGQFFVLFCRKKENCLGMPEMARKTLCQKIFAGVDGETSRRSRVYRPKNRDPIGGSGNITIIRFCDLKGI